MGINIRKIAAICKSEKENRKFLTVTSWAGIQNPGSSDWH